MIDSQLIKDSSYVFTENNKLMVID